MKFLQKRQKKVYKKLTQKDVDAIEREISISIKKKNILKILENIGTIFTGTYFHHKEMSKGTIFERSIVGRVKSRKQRLDIIIKNKEKISNELFKEYLDYSNPDTMIKRLKDASDKKNKYMIESINKKLSKMKNIVKNVRKGKVFKTEENEKILDIV